EPFRYFAFDFDPPLLCDCTLTKNGLSVLYEDHALLELTNPVPADRTISAQMTEIASMWGKLGEHVSEMDVLFEVISPTVRQNPVVQNVDFAYSPRVESGLREYLVEQLGLAYLHVSRAQSQTLYGRGFRKCTEIAVMQNPSSGRDHAI